MIIMPMPIYSGHGGGNMTGLEIFYAIIISIYFCQSIAVWVALFFDGDEYFPNKKSFLFWQIPIIPLFYFAFKKFMTIGRKK